MDQIIDFFKDVGSKVSSSFSDNTKLFLFYDSYKVNQQYGFIAPGTITNYVRLIEAEDLDSAIYSFVMNFYHDGIDWSLLDHKEVRDTYSDQFPTGEVPSFMEWIQDSIEEKKIQTKSLVPFMKKFFINVPNQNLCISVQEIEPFGCD